MRYNPSTDRAVDIDDIAAQCRAAITIPQAAVPQTARFGAVAAGCWHRWRQYGAGHELSGSRDLAESLEGWHHAAVAAAMGDHVKARLIRRQLMLLP